jgi:cysteine desulfurase
MASDFIYLDHNSTTPVDPLVLETMLPFFTQTYGNAASRTHAQGWAAAQAIDTARAQTAALINAEPQEIIFTSGATEALNLAIQGVFERYTTKGKHIITVATEHKAVLDTCKALEKRGAEITILPVNREGLLDLSELENALRNDTILVAVMAANNETGTVQPISEIAARVHARGSLFLCDATQAAGKTAIDVNDWGVDLLCLSAHKFYGPKSVGALFVRRKNPRVSLEAIIHGGGHERGLRSGTLNVPGIAGLGKAAELAAANWWEYAMHTSSLRTRLEHRVTELPQTFINGSVKNRLPNTSSLTFLGIQADKLMAKLPQVGIAAGSACTSALPEPSHVLRAMGLNENEAYATIRLSWGKNNTIEETDWVIERLLQAIPTLR